MSVHHQSRTLATLRDTLLPQILSMGIASGIPKPQQSL